MDTWQLVLYAGASMVALHSLVSLMSHHRRRHRRQLLLEYQQHRQQALRAALAKPDSESSPQSAVTKAPEKAEAAA